VQFLRPIRCRQAGALLLAGLLAGCAVVPPRLRCRWPGPKALLPRKAWPAEGRMAFGRLVAGLWRQQLDALIAEGWPAPPICAWPRRFARAQAASGEARSRLLPADRRCRRAG
jgi:hypothetical protein